MKLKRFQCLFLSVLLARPPGARFSSYGGNGGPIKAWKCAVSLAKLGLVDGPTEVCSTPDFDPPHTINDRGRRWWYDNQSPVEGHRDVLTGEDLSMEELMEDGRIREQIRELAGVEYEVDSDSRRYMGYMRSLVSADAHNHYDQRMKKLKNKEETGTAS